ncbi:MAG: hypothetical protein WKF94_08690 [Solirubrobacteraceae bacterium]
MKLSKVRLTGATALAAVTGVAALGAPSSEAQKGYDTPKPATVSAVLVADDGRKRHPAGLVESTI